jgi:hypothetical protein
MPGQDAPYSAHGLWGYDTTQDEIVGVELNPVPDIPVHRGRFNSDDSLDLMRRNEAGAVVEKSRIHWIGVDELVFEAECPGAQPERLRFAGAAAA